MTSLFAARRAAEEFADLVDRTLTGAHPAGGGLDTLTGVVTLLREQPKVEARPAFVSDLRERLLAAAATELAPVAPTLRPVPAVEPTAHPRRFGTAAAAALVVIGGTTGVAAAAAGALPGDGLYSVKRGIESATAALNTTDAGKGSDLLRQADTRLREIEALSAAGADAAAISSTLADFQDTAQSGAGLLFRSYQATGRSSDIATVRDFAADQQAALEAISDLAPTDALDDVDAAAASLAQIEDEAVDLCAGCGGNDLGEASDAFALQSLITMPAAAPVRAPQPRQVSPRVHRSGDASAAPATTSAPAAPAPVRSTPPEPTQALAPAGEVVKKVTEPLTTSITGPVAGVVDQVGDATGLSAVTDPVTGILKSLG